MIILKLKGGLGNQLFQYSYALNLSFLNNTDIQIDTFSGFENDYYNREYVLYKFKIPQNFINNSNLKGSNWFLEKMNRLLDLLFRTYKNRKFLNEEGFHFNKKLLDINITKKIYVEGYFQSFRYFENISNKLKELYKLKKKYKTKDFFRLEKKINDSNSISVHIRDYSIYKSSKDNLIYKSCSIEYYKRSIELLKNKINNPVFFIFTDNIDYAKSVFPFKDLNSINVSKLSDCEELTLMSSCNHNIISNSTFSWWGAWLNLNFNKIVIGPEEWFIDKKKTINDLYPESWIRISNN
jgi:hypothetical protein